MFPVISLIMSVHAESILCAKLHFLPGMDCPHPQIIDNIRQLIQNLNIIIGVLDTEFLHPLFDELTVIRFQLPDDLIRIIGHAGISQQKMINIRAAGTLTLIDFTRLVPVSHPFLRHLFRLIAVPGAFL